MCFTDLRQPTITGLKSGLKGPDGHLSTSSAGTSHRVEKISDWRDHFCGRIDDRMITQLFPLEFTGSLGVAMPNAWHIIQTAKDDGVEISFVGLDDRPIYSDFVSITR